VTSVCLALALSNRATLKHNFGLASDCIGCGQCERRCPQHLPITTFLKEIGDCLDGRTHHD